MLTRTRKVPALFLSLLVLAATVSSSDIRPDSGTTRDNIYKNDFFGFSYTFPKGWSLLQQQSQTGIRLAPGAALVAFCYSLAKQWDNKPI